MKKTSFILFLILISCSSLKETKNSSEKKKIEIFTNSQNYTLKIPNHWKTVIDHDFISYTPKDLNDIFHKNTVRVFKIAQKEKTSLKEIIDAEIKKLKKVIKINSQQVIKDKTQFGTTYIHQYKHSWNLTNYEVITYYFKVKNNYYLFSYSSDERFQKKYYYDALSIFKSFTLK
ncbi:hypothetical protein H0I31_01300 [Tenacibaculum sp. AHE15PA]|uniref:hypothetical protein n=1 Tax=unclassified Tenacibaculum TaxID=2635139 RepID=UPI001C4F1B1B|nr:MULTISPECIES: hypothetical protein [unclassified Tenacibaculum]QXP72371.1 hypothetical protein H0I30_06560 [Tenacibaculum sp. AHE14PA]QXP76286.1 hypothetical protein H0I31_01300 [Tenacibaculum sp. AHE15PA]